MNLTAGPLADALGEGPTLLVFLRHFGCIFCREMVRDVRRAAEETPGYPGVMFVFQGSVEQGLAFFGRWWPTARAIADPSARLYRAMGVRRGSAGQMIGLRVWGCGLRALGKGNFIGKAVGDPWLMPGAFLVHRGAVAWTHQFKHAGDHPDWRAVPLAAPA